MSFQKLAALAKRFFPDEWPAPNASVNNTFGRWVAACGEEGAHKKLTELLRYSSPIITQGTKDIYAKWILCVQAIGTPAARKLYEEMTVDKLIDRFLKNRATVFWNPTDDWMIVNPQYDPTQDGSKPFIFGYGGYDKFGLFFENGISPIEPALNITDLITYEEQWLSRLLGASSMVEFLNPGGRGNKGELAQEGTFQLRGIKNALTGERFENPEQQASISSLVTETKNTSENGYGKEASEDKANLKGQHLKFIAAAINLSYLPTWSDVKAIVDAAAAANEDISSKFLFVPWIGGYLNVEAYKNSIRNNYFLQLLSANANAEHFGQEAVVSIVSLGTGAWGIALEQGNYSVDVITDLLKSGIFPHIGTVKFVWFSGNGNLECGTAVQKSPIGTEERQGVINTPDGREIKVIFTIQDPAIPLSKEELLVAMYAWDSNAYPGNEFWHGSKYLGASGDPAAASCSQISWLQNSRINIEGMAGKNTRVYREDGTVYRLGENQAQKSLEDAVECLAVSEDTSAAAAAADATPFACSP